MERIVLTASSGMVYTDGINGGKVVYLAKNQLADDWYEISEEDFISAVENGTSIGEATVADYQAALQELGVNI